MNSLYRCILKIMDCKTGKNCCDNVIHLSKNKSKKSFLSKLWLFFCNSLSCKWFDLAYILEWVGGETLLILFSNFFAIGFVGLHVRLSQTGAISRLHEFVSPVRLLYTPPPLHPLPCRVIYTLGRKTPKIISCNFHDTHKLFSIVNVALFIRT